MCANLFAYIIAMTCLAIEFGICMAVIYENVDTNIRTGEIKECRLLIA